MLGCYSQCKTLCLLHRLGGKLLKGSLPGIRSCSHELCVPVPLPILGRCSFSVSTLAIQTPALFHYVRAVLQTVAPTPH